MPGWIDGYFYLYLHCMCACTSLLVSVTLRVSTKEQELYYIPMTFITHITVSRRERI